MPLREHRQATLRGKGITKMTLAQTTNLLKIAEQNQARLDALQIGLADLMEQQQETIKMVEAFDAQYPSLPSNDILEDQADYFGGIR